MVMVTQAVLANLNQNSAMPKQLGGDEHTDPMPTFPSKSESFKVPEGRHPRGTVLREALRGNLPLGGFSGASAGVSLRVLRGLRGALRVSAGVRGIFRG